MKVPQNMIIVTLLLWTLSFGQAIIPTAQLPDNKLIHNQMDKDSLPKGVFKVEGTYLKKVPLLTLNQGNWQEITYLVIYTVADSSFPYSELSFIVKDRSPLRESKIHAKKQVFPFIKGKKQFFLLRDTSCRFKDYYIIESY